MYWPTLGGLCASLHQGMSFSIVLRLFSSLAVCIVVFHNIINCHLRDLSCVKYLYHCDHPWHFVAMWENAGRVCSHRFRDVFWGSSVSTRSLSASNFSNICCHVVRIVCKCVKYFFVKRKWCVPRFKFLRPLIEARHSYILNVAVFRIQELLGLEARWESIVNRVGSLYGGYDDCYAV
jgi:hypothetical protein